MDKVLSNLLRQFLVVINDDIEHTNMACLQLFKKRKEKNLGHILNEEDTKKAIKLILSASEKTRSEEAYKISFLKGPKTVGSLKNKKFIRIQEDIVLFEYVTLDVDGEIYALEKEKNLISESTRFWKEQEETNHTQCSTGEIVSEKQDGDDGLEPESNDESEPAKKKPKLEPQESENDV